MSKYFQENKYISNYLLIVISNYLQFIQVGVMSIRFAKDDDPTEILQFSFLNENGTITKSSIKSALMPPYPPKYYINACLSVVGKYIQNGEKVTNIKILLYSRSSCISPVELWNNTR